VLLIGWNKNLQPHALCGIVFPCLVLRLITSFFGSVKNEGWQDEEFRNIFKKCFKGIHQIYQNTFCIHVLFMSIEITFKPFFVKEDQTEYL